jgi:ribosome-associated protein
VTPEELKERIDTSELFFLTSRSSGPGGQNVNKVNTKVEVHFDFQHSNSLTEREKELISLKLKTRINSDGELIVKSQSERSQLKNKKKAIERIFILISEALAEKPVRELTLPTQKSRIERLDEKKRRGYIKKMRKDGSREPDDITPP